MKYQKHAETKQQSERRLKQIQRLLVEQANLQHRYWQLEENFSVLLAELAKLKKQKNCGKVKK